MSYLIFILVFQVFKLTHYYLFIFIFKHIKVKFKFFILILLFCYFIVFLYLKFNIFWEVLFLCCVYQIIITVQLFWIATSTCLILKHIWLSTRLAAPVFQRFLQLRSYLPAGGQTRTTWDITLLLERSNFKTFFTHFRSYASVNSFIYNRLNVLMVMINVIFSFQKFRIG